MEQIWANRLIAGTQTWEKCLKSGRADGVKAVLKARVKGCSITAEKYTEIVGEPYKE